jgi:hypothetical protein
MKPSSQKREHVIIVPGGLLATGPHADPRCSVPACEVDGDLAQHGQVARCRLITDAAVILPRDNLNGPSIRQIPPAHFMRRPCYAPVVELCVGRLRIEMLADITSKQWPTSSEYTNWGNVR